MSIQSKELSYRLRVIVYHPLFLELSFSEQNECVHELGSARKVSDLSKRWRNLLRAVERSPVPGGPARLE